MNSQLSINKLFENKNSKLLIISISIIFDNLNPYFVPIEI